MSGLPDGVLTIVLDSCFSGGMEKMFMRADGQVEFGKIKSWISLDPAEIAKHTELSGTVKEFSPFGFLTPASTDIVRDHLAQSTKDYSAQPFQVTELRNSDSKGLLLSACLDSETAAASTSETSGLSAFTFALTSAVKQLGSSAIAKDIIAAAGALLRQIGIGQTPMLKEPSNPPHLGSTVFPVLESAGTTTGTTAATTTGTTKDSVDDGVGLSPDDIQELTERVTLAILRIKQGAQAMTTAASAQNGKNFLDDISSIVPIIAAVAMQSKGTAVGSKDWIDDVGRVVNIAQSVVPLVSGLQSKGYQPNGQPNNKNFLDDISRILPLVAAVAMQSQGSQGGSKDFIGDLGRIVNMAGTVLPMISGLQSKGYQPDNKNFLNDISPFIPIVAAVAMQSKGGQPADKDWIDDVGRVMNIAQTVVPMIAGLQGKAN